MENQNISMGEEDHPTKNNYKDFTSIDALRENDVDRKHRSVDELLGNLRETKEKALFDNLSKQQILNEFQHERFIGNITARIDRLQDQARNETEKTFSLIHSFEARERKIQEEVKNLSIKFDTDTNKLKNIILDYGAKESKFEAEINEKNKQIFDLSHKIEQIQTKLDSLTDNTLQVGQNLAATSRDVQLELAKQQESSREISKHEHAINNLSVAIDLNSENFGRKMQQAAKELINRIENESKARRELEQSIKSDASDFRRFLERQIAERMGSLTAYTQQKQESDRREFESIANNLQYKLQRLETHTENEQEQLILMINQRLQNIESSFAETEKNSMRMESRMQTAVAEYMKMFESLVLKKDTENDARFKSQSSNMLKLQKALSESLDLTEQSFSFKFKNFEEVIRAEIKTRMDTDDTIQETKELQKTSEIKVQSELDKIHLILGNNRSENEKVLEMIHSLAKQITKSQEKWISSFECEFVKLHELIVNQSKFQSAELEKIRAEYKECMAEIRDESIDKSQLQEEELKKLNGAVCNLQESLAQSEQDGLKTRTTLEQKILASKVQFDSTLEALKIELMSRPTRIETETRDKEVQNKIEDLRIKSNQISGCLENLKVSSIDQEVYNNNRTEIQGTIKTLHEDIEFLKNDYSENMKNIHNLLRNNESDFVNLLQKQIDDLSSKHTDIECDVAQTANELEYIKKRQSEDAKSNSVFWEQINRLRQEFEGFQIDKIDANAKYKEFIKKVSDLEIKLSKEVSQVSDVFSKEIEDTRELIQSLSGDQTDSKQKLENLIAESNEKIISNFKTDLQNQNLQFIQLKSQVGNINSHFMSQESTLQQLSDNTNEKITSISKKLSSELQKLKQMVQEDEKMNTKTIETEISRTESSLKILKNSMQGFEHFAHNTKIMIEDLRCKSKNNEKSMNTALRDIAKTNQALILKTSEQYKNMFEYAKSQQDLKIKELKEQAERNHSDIKGLKFDISTYRKPDAFNYQGFGGLDESNEKIENLVEPINYKLDRLANQLIELESAIKMDKFQKPVNVSSSSIYKPATVDLKEKYTPLFQIKDEMTQSSINNEDLKDYDMGTTRNSNFISSREDHSQMEFEFRENINAEQLENNPKYALNHGSTSDYLIRTREVIYQSRDAKSAPEKESEELSLTNIPTSLSASSKMPGKDSDKDTSADRPPILEY
jgi:hypothetical protein